MFAGIARWPLLARVRRGRRSPDQAPTSPRPPDVTTMQLPVPLRDTTRPLATALTHAEAGRFSGILRITGEPGGDIRFAGGRVVTVTTGGAPGFDALDRAGGDRPLGAARARLLRMTATVDGAFAIAAGWIDRYHWIDADPEMFAGADPGYEPRWLLDETERRLAALIHAGFSPYRNLLALTEIGRCAADGDGAAAALLRLVDGTRSCRELAFLLGRPLYPVTVEVARLLAGGQVTVPARHATDLPPATGRTGMVDPALPRRRRGASGINDTLRPRPPQAAPPSATAADVPDPSPRRRTERIP
ncbi:hypothetical protein FEK33_16385 [Nocardia asteroides NBRC 15531]|nr:hypothetical protein [Nocardia asteroides]TLF67512.1 hypothetical protein FEK33_16385 [Nocardia asteroides NBRC 15531]UGT50991.1 hypothetical protein LT345_10835 [Nocardia asteroides]